MDYRNEIIKRVGEEIITTPSGNTRNLLTDVNIALQKNLTVEEALRFVVKAFKEKIIFGEYEILSWQDFYCEISIEGYYKFKLWHRDRDVLRLFNTEEDIISREIVFDEIEAKKAYKNLFKLKQVSDGLKIKSLEKEKAEIEKKLKWLKRND